MKIAISCTAANLDAATDSRFGRAAFFYIYDTGTQNGTFLDNSENLNAASGAGVQTGQSMIENKVETVITGHLGPKALTILKGANIKGYKTLEGATVQNTLKAFLGNELTALDMA